MLWASYAERLPLPGGPPYANDDMPRCPARRAAGAPSRYAHARVEGTLWVPETPARLVYAFPACARAGGTHRRALALDTSDSLSSCLRVRGGEGGLHCEEGAAARGAPAAGADGLGLRSHRAGLRPQGLRGWEPKRFDCEREGFWGDEKFGANSLSQDGQMVQQSTPRQSAACARVRARGTCLLICGARVDPSCSACL